MSNMFRYGQARVRLPRFVALGLSLILFASGAVAFAKETRGTLLGIIRDSTGAVSFDLSLFKTTRITEGVRLQLRAEGFNLFNRSEFSSPVTNFDSPNFGRIQSTNIFNRQFQFGAKLLF